MRYLFTLCSASLLFLSVVTARSQDHDKEPDTQRTLLREVDSLMLSYKFDSALRLLEKCDSAKADILLRISQCNFRLGRTDAAISSSIRVLRMDSMSVAALNQLGQLYSRNGDYPGALDSFVRLIGLDSTNGFYYKQAGLMASRMEDNAKARIFFSTALNYNPADIESSLALGNILMEMEEYESVDTVVRLALALAPASRSILLLRARSDLEQQHYGSVVVTVNTLLQQSDTTVLFARLLGESYLHLQQYPNLIDCMLFLLKNRYEDERVYYCMGIALQELGDAGGSIPWFERAAQKSISQNTKVYFLQLGRSYEAMKKYAEAIRAYRTAYNYSKDPILLYHLGRNYDVYYKEREPALDHYRKYLRSDDTTSSARDYARRRMQDMGEF
jgi:tetratricopeptide (TPR) repeat protein